MDRSYKKAAASISNPRVSWGRHTNHRGYRKALDRIDRRRLNRKAKIDQED